VSTNANIFTSPRPSLSVILNAINDLKAVWQDVASGLKVRKSLLPEKEKLLLELMFELAHYVKNIANGDENIIRLAGLQIKPISKKV